MNIRVDLNIAIADGTEVVFRSPADCSQVTGMVVYHNDGKTDFVLADAHGNNVGDIDHLFAENAVVKVILDVSTGMAFVQNADTNAYIEGTFVKSVNGKKPDKLGNVEVPVGTATYEQIVAAVEDYLNKNPIDGGVDAEKLAQAVNAALQTAKESGEFDGPQGDPGKDGTSVAILSISESEDDEDVNVVVFSDGKTLNIKNGKTGKTPVKGEDYFTEADKAETVNAVLSALPTWEGGSY